MSGKIAPEVCSHIRCIKQEACLCLHCHSSLPLIARLDARSACCLPIPPLISLSRPSSVWTLCPDAPGGGEGGAQLTEEPQAAGCGRRAGLPRSSCSPVLLSLITAARPERRVARRLFLLARWVTAVDVRVLFFISFFGASWMTL